jgi:hypothetical protein
MGPKEETIIRNWNEEAPYNIDVRLVLTKDKRSGEFEKFGERLSHLAPKIHIQEEKTEAADLPAIQICENIRYHAVPIQKELEPFLEALVLFNKSETPQYRGLDKINIPATLSLYIALECSFCPEAVRKLLPLAVNNPMIRFSVFDAALFDDRAKAEGIRSVPTVLLDGNYRWTGSPPVSDIVHMMIHRNPSQLSASSLESILKEGDAESVARMMIRHGLIFPAFIDLLVHDKWHVRLGAMVAMESVLEEDADLAAQAVKPIWDRIQTAENSVKGDILYILGKIGDNDMIPKLESISTDTANKEIKEAATEAIETIKKKQIVIDTSCDEDEGACHLPDFLD